MRSQRLCAEHDVTLIEDAAHALGARWRGKQIGAFGKVGCFSFQSNKVINAGEGGMLTTDDDEIIVKATYLSGRVRDELQEAFHAELAVRGIRRKRFLQINTRMTNLTAAVARPQIGLLEEKGQRYRQMYAYLKRELDRDEPHRSFRRNIRRRRAFPIPSSSGCPDTTPRRCRSFIERVRESGLPLAGFAERRNARAFFNWHYLGEDMPDLPQTRKAIESTCDMRLPSTLQQAHLDYIVAAVRSALHEVDAMTRMRGRLSLWSHRTSGPPHG